MRSNEASRVYISGVHVLMKDRSMENKKRIDSPAPAFDDLARSLFEIGVIKLGEFKLKSGIISPFYFDMRCVISHPSILRRMAGFYIEKCGELEFLRIAGIPFTGLPIAVAVSLAADYPMVFGRREAKGHGVSRQIEGSFNAGDRVLLIDDVITDGQSKLEYANIFINNGLAVRDILVFLDREQGGRENMDKHDITLHAVCTMTRLLESLLRSGCIDEGQYTIIHDFILKK